MQLWSMVGVLRHAVYAALGLALMLGFSVDDAQANNCGVQTFVVDSYDDGDDASSDDCECATAEGKCTLRAAVQQANYDEDEDIVRFKEKAKKHYYYKSYSYGPPEYDGYAYYDRYGRDLYGSKGKSYGYESYGYGGYDPYKTYDHVAGCRPSYTYDSLYDAPPIHRLTDGPIHIEEHLVMIGHGPCETIIDARENSSNEGGSCNNGSNNGRIFTTSSGGSSNPVVDVTIMGLRLQNGLTEVNKSGPSYTCSGQLAGGCMRNSTADVLLEDVHFKGCRALCSDGIVACSADAGALYNSEGSMQLIDTLFFENTAADDGGAVNQGAISTSAHSAKMRIYRSRFINNDAPGDPDGPAGRAGALINRAGRGWLGIYDSLFKQNSTGGQGGAIENRDTSDGGVVSNSEFIKNSCDDGPNCGGAIADQGDFSVQDDNSFEGNTPNDEQL